MKSRAGQVIIEVADFGFGPATTALAAVRLIRNDFSLRVVSTGNAGLLLRQELPHAAHYELNTWDPTRWDDFRKLVPQDSVVVISVANPPFATWALRQSYRVGLLDSLDWLWPDDEEDLLSLAEFHLVQAYYGRQTSRAIRKRQWVRPVVDPKIWPSGQHLARSGTSVVAFGGMNVPGQETLVARYVRWLLPATLDVLINEWGSHQVTIVGGRPDLESLVPLRWRRHPALQVRVGMARANYAALIRSAEHLVLTPGLASIYECMIENIQPIYQPGFNLSMIIQLDDLMAAGYPYAIAWPWQSKTVQSARGLAESDGLRVVAAHITQTITSDDDSFIRAALLRSKEPE